MSLDSIRASSKEGVTKANQKRPRGLRLASIAGALLLTAAGLGHPGFAPGTLNPQLSVIDGDTLELDGQAIELVGIDAPELGQWCHDGSVLYACGLAAAFELHKLLALDPVTCTPTDAESRVYECRTSESTLGQRLAERGLATARTRTDVQMAERTARGVPLGIWRGKFVDPDRWRDGHRLPEETREVHVCPILGLNLNAADVYVVPTDPDYREWEGRFTEVVRRFCSDEHARASGYSHLSSR